MKSGAFPIIGSAASQSEFLIIMSGINWKKLNVWNCVFMGVLLLTTATAVPAYIWNFGLDGFYVGLFVTFFIFSGLSITLGYHRLFSHRSFKAAWPVKLATLLFGAAALENSALLWARDHRRHHKFTDDKHDPYNAKQGFFYSHIGWILLDDSSRTDMSYVKDLQQDKLVMWQHNNYLLIAIGVGLGIPALLGALYNGWVGALGGFLIGGVGRAVAVQQFTFFINSLCHMVGKQPYSDKSTARDSGLMAIFTFGEGYHNFHHTFQHDYRNGVKSWQFDPTKWTIWILYKLGLAKNLRRVPEERIIQAEITEQCRQLEKKISKHGSILAEPIMLKLQTAKQTLENAYRQWEVLEAEYAKALEKNLEASKEKLTELKQEFHEAKERFSLAIQDWRETHQLVLAQFA